MNKKVKGIIILTVMAIFGITTLAFAGWGRGCGHMTGPGGWGAGMHNGYGYGQEGYYGNLSADEIAKIDEQRAKFFKATLNYEIQARKTAPNYNRGPGGYGPMMGYGPRGGGYCMW